MYVSECFSETISGEWLTVNNCWKFLPISSAICEMSRNHSTKEKSPMRLGVSTIGISADLITVAIWIPMKSNMVI